VYVLQITIAVIPSTQKWIHESEGKAIYMVTLFLDWMPVTYGAGSWTIMNKMEGAWMTWERRILRKIYRPPYENCYWRIKVHQELYTALNTWVMDHIKLMNQEIYNKFKSLDVTIIKVHWFEWLWHIVGRRVKKLLESKPGFKKEYLD
jgi:hypothetical protein